MQSERAARSHRILAVGCGNALRSDGGIGTYLAARVADWHLPQVRSLAVPRVAPDIVTELKTIDLVVFINGCASANGCAGSVQLSSLSPLASASPSDPQFLLAAAESLYGRAPHAWHLSVPGANFTAGDRLSPQAEQNIEQALSCLQVLCGAPVPVSPPRATPAHHGETA